MPQRAAMIVCLCVVLYSTSPSTALWAREPASEPSSESPSDALELSRLVVQHPEFRDYVSSLMRSELAPRTESGFGFAYMEQNDAVWSALQSDMATSLDARFSSEELATALAGFRENPDEEWQKASEIYRAAAKALGNEATETRRQMGIFGCAAGILGPNLEQARAQAQAGGRDIVYDDEFFGKLAPILESTEATCACVLDKTIEKYGDGYLTDPENAGDEPLLYSQQLLSSGECPNPFAGLPQDG